MRKLTNFKQKVYQHKNGKLLNFVLLPFFDSYSFPCSSTFGTCNSNIVGSFFNLGEPQKRENSNLYEANNIVNGFHSMKKPDKSLSERVFKAFILRLYV